MDNLTDHQTEAIHLTHHKILDLITEVTTIPTAMIHAIDKISTGTMAETKVINNNQDTNREIKVTKTGMITTKIEIGSTIEEDQINTNTIETSTIHKSFWSSQTRT